MATVAPSSAPDTDVELVARPSAAAPRPESAVPSQSPIDALVALKGVDRAMALEQAGTMMEAACNVAPLIARDWFTPIIAAPSHPAGEEYGPEVRPEAEDATAARRRQPWGIWCGGCCADPREENDVTDVELQLTPHAATTTPPIRRGWCVLLLPGGTTTQINVVGYLLRAMLLLLIWFALYSILPPWLLERQGYVLDPLLLVVVSSVVGGMPCRMLNLPPLIGILIVAVLWSNIGTSETVKVGYFTSGIYPYVYKVVSGLGVTTILLRAGMGWEWHKMRPMLGRVVLLSTIPMLLEAATHGGVAYATFGYTASVVAPVAHHPNYLTAFLQGLIISPTSPAVVVPGTIAMKARGIGNKDPGPLTLLLAACALETALVNWASNFLVSVIYVKESNGGTLALTIMLGPIQMVIGIALGIVLGAMCCGLVELFLWEAVPLPNGRYSPYHLLSVSRYVGVIMALMALSMYFFAARFGFGGGASLGVMALSATFTHIMALRKPSPSPPPVVIVAALNTSSAIGNNNAASPTTTTTTAVVEKDAATALEGANTEPITTTTHSTMEHRRSFSSASPGPMSKDAAGPSSPSTSGPDSRNGGAPDESAPKPNTAAAAAATTTAPLLGDHYTVTVTKGVADVLSALWDEIVMPCLFAAAGSRMLLTQAFNGSFFPAALASLIAGLVARIIGVVLVTAGKGFTPGQLGLMCIMWASKATNQVSLMGLPLQGAQSYAALYPGDPVGAEMIAAASLMLQMAPLCTVLCAPPAALALTLIGPKVLRSDAEVDAEAAAAAEADRQAKSDTDEQATRGERTAVDATTVT